MSFQSRSKVEYLLIGCSGRYCCPARPRNNRHFTLSLVWGRGDSKRSHCKCRWEARALRGGHRPGGEFHRRLAQRRTSCSACSYETASGATRSESPVQGRRRRVVGRLVSATSVHPCCFSTRPHTSWDTPSFRSRFGGRWPTLRHGSTQRHPAARGHGGVWAGTTAASSPPSEALGVVGASDDQWAEMLAVVTASPIPISEEIWSVAGADIKPSFKTSSRCSPLLPSPAGTLHPLACIQLRRAWGAAPFHSSTIARRTALRLAAVAVGTRALPRSGLRTRSAFCEQQQPEGEWLEAVTRIYDPVCERLRTCCLRG